MEKKAKTWLPIALSIASDLFLSGCYVVTAGTVTVAPYRHGYYYPERTYYRDYPYYRGYYFYETRRYYDRESVKRKKHRKEDIRSRVYGRPYVPDHGHAYQYGTRKYHGPKYAQERKSRHPDYRRRNR